VPYDALQPGGMLVVYVHAIGSRRSWLSPAVSVGAGTIACLDVYANSDGDLGRSMLYTTLAGTISAAVRRR
jgi:hypothetical protein